MIVQSHEFSGTNPYLSLSVSICKAWYAIGVVIVLILFRLWVLWDRSPRLMLGTLTFFVVTQLVALSLTGYVINDMLPTLIFDPVLRICMPMAKPKLVMMWSPGIVFEFMIFLATVWNALDRPRSPNVRMTKILYRDRGLYFFNSLTFMGVLWVSLVRVLRVATPDTSLSNVAFLERLQHHARPSHS
ncbi:hypothetical protein HD554DRAFT_2127895 [Boletus coccyginus]|nr:hypothetical protein HD554DRAFT_2127895 [Boletus coccyginus]